MKIKVLSVIFSAILVLSLTGCGKDDVDSSASDTGSSTTEVADNATDSIGNSPLFIFINRIFESFKRKYRLTESLYDRYTSYIFNRLGRHLIEGILIYNITIC